MYTQQRFPDLISEGNNNHKDHQKLYRLGFAYGKWIYRFRWLILVIWLIAFGISAAFGMKISSVLTGGGLDLKESESYHVTDILTEKFHQPGTSLIVVFQADDANVSDIAYQKEVGWFRDRLQIMPNVQYVTQGPTSKNNHTTFLLASFSKSMDAMQEDYLKAKGDFPDHDSLGPARYYLTDHLALSDELIHTTLKDVERADLTALPVALFILIIVFGTFVAAIMPILLTLISIPMALALLYPIGRITPVSTYALSVASIIGLGISIDYSLFIIRRFREELARGSSVETAIAWSLATAGEAILFSGLTVLIGFTGLFLARLSIADSIALGGGAVVICSVLAALTFLPALLSVVGKRINSLRVPFLWKLTIAQPSRYRKRKSFWHELASAVMKRPIITIFAVLIILGVLGWPALSMRIGTSSEKSLPTSSDGRRGLEILHEQFPSTRSQQIQLIIHTNNQSKIVTAENIKRLRNIIQWLKKQRDIDSVESILEPPNTPQSTKLSAEQITNYYDSGAYKQNAALSQFVDDHLETDYTYLTIRSRAEISSEASKDFILNLRANLPVQDNNFSYQVGGTQALHVDFDAYLYGNFPKVVLFVITATLILLMIMFRSILIPLKAVIMNALSISATYGILVFVFQWGHLSRFLSFDPVGYVSNVVPIILFAILFGLSMDYEVFLLSRIREEWMRTKNNRQAVALGLEHTGSVITNAALLFIVVTVAFIFTSQTITKEMGVGMTMAILVDATIVRSLLVPATMRLLGRWNWWFPGLPVPPRQRKENDIMADVERRYTHHIHERNFF